MHITSPYCHYESLPNLRQSSFVLLVENKKDLPNAITLNTSMFNLARFLGPAIGGLLIAHTSATICFFINFLCILPNIFLVKMMKIEDVKSENVQKENIFDGLKDGFKYISKNPEIFVLQTYLATFCMLMLAYPMLMSIYTVEVLKNNANILGYLLSAVGIGSLITSLLLSAKTSSKGLRRILFIGCLAISLVYILLGLNSSEHIALILMFFGGLALTCVISPENILLQSIVDEEKRGMVMSFMVTISISSYLCGVLAHHFGIGNTFIILGATTFLIGSTLSFMLSKFNYNKE